MDLTSPRLRQRAGFPYHFQEKHTMAKSTLDPDNIPESDRELGKGHGTRALGPSDTSDGGSDVQSSMRWTNEADIGLDKGTNEDPDAGRRDRSAGPDIGDAELDSDTDSSGTGERASAGRDSDIAAGADIAADEIGQMDMDETADDLDPDLNMPPVRHPNRAQPSRR
jgi:hypothetical protein